MSDSYPIVFRPWKQGRDTLNLTVDFAQLADAFRRFTYAADDSPDHRWLRPVNETHAAGFRKRWTRGSQFTAGLTAKAVCKHLRDGYNVPGLRLSDDDLVSLVEKPRPNWNDTEGEFHFDLWESGIPECFVEKRNRESIPGIKVEIELSQNANMNGEACADWASFCLRSLVALEAAGIDLEVSGRITIDSLYHRQGAEENVPTVATLIRCKRFGEAINYRSFSGLFSPAGFRILGFWTLVRASDSMNRDVTGGLGRSHYPKGGYRVEFNGERDALTFIPTSSSGASVDTNRLTAELLTAVDQSRKASR